ncbi:hypothetical protein AB0L40_01650 [Patulibacter sp. NPDC049589]|uniref:hypothetical protein n=1 Tax=Patulibacter sp. NPDC049589 TaxID=3154731 RepID=UPI00342C26FC
MTSTTSRIRRRATTSVASLGAAAAIVAVGVSAASTSAATPGDQATTRAGTCQTSYSSSRDLTAAQQLLGRTPAGRLPDGVASQPAISRDSRANRVVAYTSTSTTTATPVAPGTRNIFVVRRTGTIAKNANAWQVGATQLISVGTGGAAANGDSFGASISGYTGGSDAAKGPSKLAFLSKATNLPGGNATGTSAFTASVNGGGISRIDAPGTATGVGISGDSKLVYVSTESGLYVQRGSRVKKLVSGSGISSPSTTLNGKQAAYEQNGTVFTIKSNGSGRKKIAKGTAPQSDGGNPSGSGIGLIRAIAFKRGGGAWRAEIAGSKVRQVRFGNAPGGAVSINGGGNGVGFGNGANVCLQVRLLGSDPRSGGYDIPQGACPAGQGDVTDVSVSTRYNYLAFACSKGGLYLQYVGGK